MAIKKIFIKWMLLAFMFASFWQTYGLVDSHFTHFDDIGVAKTLLFQPPGDVVCPEVFAKIERKFQLSLQFFEVPICTLDFWRSRLFIIPSQWTYAPFQFWLTQALLEPRQFYSYEQIKYLGRIPSFISNCFGLLAFYFLLRKKIPPIGSNLILSLSLTSLIAFSLEQRIMSVQMESYAIGLLSNCFVLFGFLRLINFNALQYRSILFSVCLIVFGISMQYQAVLLTVAGFIALGVELIRSKIFKSSSKKLALLFIAIFIFSYGLIGNIFLLVDRGVRWNAGPNKEFLVQGKNLIEKIINLISLVIHESAYNIYSVTTAIEISDGMANVFGLLIILLIFFGLWSLLISKKIEDRFIFSLSIAYFFLYGELLLLGKLTYSPTRHLLYFLPMIIILSGYGVVFLRQVFPIKKGVDAILILCLIGYLGGALVSFSSFKEKRFDLLTDALMDGYIQKSKADFILLGSYDLDPHFLPSTKKTVVFDFARGVQCEGLRKILIQPDQKIRFIWFSRRSEIEPENKDFQKYLTELIGGCFETKSYAWDLARYQKIGDLMRISSATEIDLSNRTKNGSNNYFIQLYEIKNSYDSNSYYSSLDAGIDFKNQGYPNFLKFTSGLSQVEAWGRWSDSSQGNGVVEFGFRDPLPERFVLEFKALPYANNGQSPTRVRVGNQEHFIYINGSNGDEYALTFNNKERSNVVEFYPPNPVSPAANAGISSDPRKLGIGFISLRIRAVNN